MQGVLQEYVGWLHTTGIALHQVLVDNPIGPSTVECEAELYASV